MNRNLVRRCRLGAWGERAGDSAVAGDIQNIDAIPDASGRIQDLVPAPPHVPRGGGASPEGIDQSISRNMYLETRDLGDMMDIYYAAWERGVKTTYYPH